MEFGFTLSSEEHPAMELVRLAQRAEHESGFDFVSISDHFHPWVDAQGNSPFVWSTLGGIAATTDRIDVGVGVTCPILRIHPAIVAHAAATTATMFGDRFFLGVGTGELLNEHVLGQRWPRIETRRAMLAEAIGLMRQLWTGDVVDHDGPYYTVENARLYNVPEQPVPIVMSGLGPGSARVAAELGCGLWTTTANEPAVEAYRSAGGDGPVVGQLTLCWAPDRDAALDIVETIWPTAGLAGQLSQELPSPPLFEQACTTVRREDLAEAVVCGSDVGAVVEAVEEFRRLGFTRVHLHQIGHDQDPFFDAWERELRAALAG